MKKTKLAFWIFALIGIAIFLSINIILASPILLMAGLILLYWKKRITTALPMLLLSIMFVFLNIVALYVYGWLALVDIVLWSYGFVYSLEEYQKHD